jgi:hypothetical protein
MKEIQYQFTIPYSTSEEEAKDEYEIEKNGGRTQGLLKGVYRGCRHQWIVRLRQLLLRCCKLVQRRVEMKMQRDCGRRSSSMQAYLGYHDILRNTVLLLVVASSSLATRIIN